jgi:hypothetical protein
MLGLEENEDARLQEFGQMVSAVAEKSYDALHDTAWGTTIRLLRREMVRTS